MAGSVLVQGTWADKWKADDAERLYYEKLTQHHKGDCASIAAQIAKARQHITEQLESLSSPSDKMTQADVIAINKRLNALEAENKSLKEKVATLECRLGGTCEKKTSAAPAAAPEKLKKDGDDDDVDLFGSDEEEEDPEAARIREERLAAYNAKKEKKPALIAKSSILLDVKPWDDETDMKKLEECVRSIHADGLLWGASKLVPLAYGIFKLQINCVVEDDKVGTDFLEEEICKFEDYIQSIDIAAFNKI